MEDTVNIVVKIEANNAVCLRKQLNVLAEFGLVTAPPTSTSLLAEFAELEAEEETDSCCYACN